MRLTPLLLFAIVGGARAQEAPAEEPGVRLGPETTEVVPSVRPDDSVWRWQRLSPFTLGRLSDVVMSRGGSLVVSTRDGGVWSGRQGERWDQELAPFGAGGLALSNDEEVLLGIEVRVEELLDEFGDTPFDELTGRSDDEDAVAAEEAATAVTDVAGGSLLAAASEAGDQVQTELINDPWFLRGADGESRSYVGRPRLELASGLFLARADGLWRREHLRWTRVYDKPVTALVETATGLWAATLGGGLITSEDGDSWVTVDGPPVEHVFELLGTDYGLLAGTDAGLWGSVDGGPFVQMGPLVEPVVMLADAGDRLWAATPETVWWSDDGGRVLQTTTGERLAGVQGMLPWQGGLLAATGAGVWRTQGGENWELLSEGLGSVAARGLMETSGGPVVATDVGVFRLVPGLSTAMAHLDDFAPLGRLVTAMGRRSEFNQEMGGRVAASFVPSISVEGMLQQSDAILYQPELGTDRFFDVDYWAAVRLTWTPQGRRTFDTSDAGALFDAGDVAPAVLISGQGVSVLDESALRTGASALGRDSVEYFTLLTEELGALYRVRARLVAEQDKAGPLRGQVLHELERLELEALMDALSDGAVARWQAGRIDGSGE
jgi:hypothetical protein